MLIIEQSVRLQTYCTAHQQSNQSTDIGGTDDVQKSK